jgi:hypothetical protein
MDRKKGRPSDYELKVKPKLFLVENWAKSGNTAEEIAEKLDIAKSTLYVYMSKHPDFSDAIKKGKEEIDFKVENALCKRALGYDYFEEVWENREGKMICVKRIKKHMPPDTTAQIFWLKNRKRDIWKDKWVIDKEDEYLSNGLNDIVNAIKGNKEEIK